MMMPKEYRYNAMKLGSAAEFARIRSKTLSGKRNVYFIRHLGADAALADAVMEMDRDAVKNGGLYVRLSSLPAVDASFDAAYYLQQYETLLRDRRCALKLTHYGDAFFGSLYSAVTRTTELFRRYKPSDTMVRNFGVKLTYRIDKILSSVTEVWDDARSIKIAAEGITGLGEYLSCYALTLLGCDVMILAARRDIDAPEELLALSDVIRYSDYCDIDLPPFGSQTVSAPKVTAPPPVQPVEAPHLKIPPRAGRSTPTQSASPPVQSAPPPIQPTEAPHLKIPEHPGRRTPPPPAPRPSAPAPRQQTSAKTSSPRTSSPQPTSPRTPINTPRSSTRQEKTYEQLAAMASSVVMILVADRHGDVEGSGSGIMISKSGLILTNHHVVRGGCRYAVRIENDDRIYETDEVIKYHPDLDLAIIRIDRPLTPVPICPAGEKLVRGQKVIAIGSPLGLFNSVSDGIISGFRDINDRDMIQFTAPISPGSSGGALLNMYGELIGISTAGIESGQNINLAVGFLDILRFAGSLLR